MTLLGRLKKRRHPTRAGDHDVCARCDLFVHSSHGDVCPRCRTAVHVTKCEGPAADPKGPYPPCLACLCGEARAHRIACLLGGIRFATTEELERWLAELKAKLEARP